MARPAPVPEISRPTARRNSSNMLRMLLRDPGSSILDHDADALRAVVRLDIDLGRQSVAGVLQGVVDELIKRLRRPPRIHREPRESPGTANGCPRLPPRRWLSAR
jgi:hypothetical protein